MRCFKIKYLTELIKKNKPKYKNCLNCRFISTAFKKYMSRDGNDIEYLESYCTYLRKKVGIKVGKIKDNKCVCFSEA